MKLTKEIKSADKEYIEFCNGMPEEEKIEFIRNNIIYDYDLSDNDELVEYIRSSLLKTRGVTSKNKRRPKISSLPHYGQLIVPKWQLKSEVLDVGLRFSEDLLYCLSNGVDDLEYKIHLFSASSRLYYLSRLIYKSKGYYAKLPEKEYFEGLFEGFMETQDEVAYRLESICKNYQGVDIATVFKCVQSLAPLTIRWVSCLNEQLYIHEFAYLIEYVLNRKGDVPYPNDGLFPNNYDNFKYCEGIGAEFEQYSF